MHARSGMSLVASMRRTGQPFWIHDAYISVGDDHVAMHANDTLVERCQFGTGHGASIGSIATGYIKKITVRDSSFNGPQQATRIKTDQGGAGFVKDVLYTNLTMADAGASIIVTMYYSVSSRADGGVRSHALP
jgi:galacturan 1,4-alpha-galacturonidase